MFYKQKNVVRKYNVQSRTSRNWLSYGNSKSKNAVQWLLCSKNSSRHMVNKRGTRILYGALIHFILAPIYNGILFSSYQSLRKEQCTPFLAGAIIGTGMGVLLQPFEVIKSRRQSGLSPCQIFTNMNAGYSGRLRGNPWLLVFILEFLKRFRNKIRTCCP